MEIDNLERILRYGKRLVAGSLISFALIYGCSKNGDESPVESENNYGIIEGIVKIDPSPYSINAIGGGTGWVGTPRVKIGLLGESSTQTSVGGWDFSEVGNTGMYQANFDMGDYDGNSVIPGIYSIRFYDGHFESSQGSIYLEEIVISKIGDSDTPIEVTAGQTTHIGTVTLTPE